VIPFVQKLGNLSEQVPDNLKVKIRLCDTMGFGVSFPNVAEPRSIPKLIWRIEEDCGISGDRVEWHGHNDFHKVHANGIAAWLYGADALNTTLFGFGERTGNPPLEGAVIEYIALKGNIADIDLSAITELAEYYQKNVKASIGGLRRNEKIYTIFDTTKLLGRPPKVAITDKSGTDGVALWVNEFLGLKGKEKLSLTKVVKIQRWVMDQYEKKGRLTAISEEELEKQVKRHFPELYERAKLVRR
jgi:isopropylmalate/homocitrate/citramalate synthase